MRPGHGGRYCGSMAQQFYDMAELRLARGSQRQRRELDAARLQSVFSLNSDCQDIDP